MYQEDVELSYRLTLHRFTILYVPDARINHKVNDGDIGPMSLYYSMRNRLLFAATRIGGWKKIASMLFLHAMIIAKLFRWSIMRRKLSKALMFAMADYWRGRFHRCTYNALSSSMAVVNSRDLKK
jgi:GT2 family glycosyltransferase